MGQFLFVENLRESFVFPRELTVNKIKFTDFGLIDDQSPREKLWKKLYGK